MTVYDETADTPPDEQWDALAAMKSQLEGISTMTDSLIGVSLADALDIQLVEDCTPGALTEVVWAWLRANRNTFTFDNGTLRFEFDALLDAAQQIGEKR